MDIVDVAEIAKRAGTSPGTIHSWRNRHADFPAPLVTLAIGPIWQWRPVEKWLAARSSRTRRAVRQNAALDAKIAAEWDALGDTVVLDEQGHARSRPKIVSPDMSRHD